MVATERRSALLVSELNRLRRQQAMTTARREIPNLWAHVQEPSEWCGWSKHILLNQRGWKARTFPAVVKVFFLTFPFIERTFQSVTSELPVIRSVAEKSLLRRRRHLEGHRFGTQPSMG